MRYLALLTLLSTGFLPTAAQAGEKKVEAEAGAEEVDPYAKFAITKTEVADIDDVFMQAETPINTLIETRKTIDGAQTEFTVALGVADGASLESALKELETLANGKIALAMEGGKPKVATADDIPEDAKKGAEALQTCLDQMQGAMEQLGTIPDDLSSLAEQAGELPGKVPTMGVPATRIPKVIKQVKNNVQALGAAKDEAKALASSLSTFQAAAMASFGQSE